LNITAHYTKQASRCAGLRLMACRCRALRVRVMVGYVSRPGPDNGYSGLLRCVHLFGRCAHGGVEAARPAALYLPASFMRPADAETKTAGHWWDTSGEIMAVIGNHRKQSEHPKPLLRVLPRVACYSGLWGFDRLKHRRRKAWGFDFPPRHQNYLQSRPSEAGNTDYTCL
jgi:hypothetical protein